MPTRAVVTVYHPQSSPSALQVARVPRCMSALHENPTQTCLIQPHGGFGASALWPPDWMRRDFEDAPSVLDPFQHVIRHAEAWLHVEAISHFLELQLSSSCTDLCSQRCKVVMNGI